ncbi:MAG: methylcrotonoyl-CoA carboxylase, partial [Rhodospirillales bacterium]|nr:methylcrotonoyl-CoA carboxylase [Rhodospirillales bacterium]
MPVIQSKLDTRSAAYKANHAAMKAQVEDLRAKIEVVREGGGAASRERHVGRGKLLPRDRIGALLDPGSPFLEFSQLAAWDMYEGKAPSASVITGVGRIAGVECVVVCNDATAQGGT